MLILEKTVKGYYECTYSRFVDTICKSVHYEMFYKCHTEIVKIMKARFAVTEPDGQSLLGFPLDYHRLLCISG